MLVVRHLAAISPAVVCETDADLDEAFKLRVPAGQRRQPFA